MATTIKADQWFDVLWDDGGLGLPQIQVGDTFTVATIDTSNRVLRLAVQSSGFTGGQLFCGSWDDASYWLGQPGFLPFTVGQLFTVQTIDVSNRVVYLSG